MLLEGAWGEVLNVLPKACNPPIRHRLGSQSVHSSLSHTPVASMPPSDRSVSKGEGKSAASDP